MPKVNPDILRWARETAGLNHETAAKKIQLGLARGVEPADRLRALEAGDRDPSRALLTRMAKQYRRPLVVFYLDTPPRRGDRGHDFRTAADSSPDAGAPMLDALIRNVMARQGLIRSALEAEDDFKRLDFVGSCSVKDGVERVQRVMQDVLGFNLAVFRKQRSYDEAFALLRNWTEACGVFVLLMGDLGSPRHNSISATTFRGFALADDVAPFVVINDRDARAAWSFTMLHELCHILLGDTGVSDVYGSTQIERFCNQVASRILLAEHELRPLADQIRNVEATAALPPITKFATEHNVSRPMIAYRLHEAGELSSDVYSTLHTMLMGQWRSQQKRARNEQGGGPSYYVVRRHRLGPGLLKAVKYLYEVGSLTTGRAGKILGVRPKNVDQLLREDSALVGA